MFKRIWPAKKITFDKALLNDLFRYALSLAHDEQQAYDLLQSCCEKVLQKPVAMEQLKPYMFKVIRNQFIDQYRRTKLELVVDSELAQHTEIEEQNSLLELENIMIDKQHVALILQELSHQDRELLYLWAIEGRTVQELAESTDTPRGTLLSRLHRLKNRLRQDYGHLIEQVS
ncbi:MAG: ECF subfamily RNA polymerase sigma-24 factor [Osedax symbiont Rs2]|nr:MAG: ECF subfamily RNA polymerase sigma-24 factor [Osedax symbiont Rs2]